MNNRGWGLREMLFLSAIILFAVILVSVLISNLYSQLEGVGTTTNTVNTYEQIENNLKNSAERYYRRYREQIGNIILSEELIDTNYIRQSQLNTETDSCEGYVIVDEDFMPFITCANYETAGY